MATGKNVQLGIYSGSTGSHLGGKIFRFRVKRGMLNTESEAGTGQRRLVSNSGSGIYWEIEFKMKVQQLTPFILTYCMPSAETDLTPFNLYVNDGITKRGFTNTLVDECSIDINQRGAIVATIKAFAIGVESKDLTITSATSDPITKVGVSTFTIGGQAITKWQRITFAVKNNVEIQESGNNPICSEIFAQHAIYTVSAEWIKNDDIVMGAGNKIKTDFTVAITDNQTPTPVTKTLTFANVVGSVNEASVEELRLVYESLEATGDSLVVT